MKLPWLKEEKEGPYLNLKITGNGELGRGLVTQIPSGTWVLHFKKKNRITMIRD